MKTLTIYLCVNFLLLFTQNLIFSCVYVGAAFSVKGSASVPNHGETCVFRKRFLCAALKILVSHFGSECQSLSESSPSDDSSSSTVKPGELTCYSCNHFCDNETEQKCNPQDDMCVDARYNDGHIDKGCANEKDFQTTWKQWSDSHDGNKGDPIKCYENLCNNKTTKHDLTCYSCNHKCDKPTERKCEPQYDMCVEVLYNDGDMDKECTNEKDYQTTWKSWSDSHNGNNGDAHKCYENLCNNQINNS
ncbi:uncharacterized protein LOC135128402 [Zophobas morio]|uniref:uncharacterized protein LOC135128402 n=1 Tax=Zophobas morio TaxID=2755281 RepID=UPI0030838C4C